MKRVIDIVRRAFGTAPEAPASHADFLRSAYRLALDREPDPVGLAFYAERLERGDMTRGHVLLALVQSYEFELRHALTPLHSFFLDPVPFGSPEAFARFVKSPPFQGAQLNELLNPCKWLDAEWRSLAAQIPSVPLSLPHMHRKGYEWVQALFGLRRLGRIGEQTDVLGVGSGHEPIVYWMANHCRSMTATDLFEGGWTADGAREGDPDVIEHPEKYQPFPYRKDRLTFRRMDGRALQFPSASFDVVFSLSSIEHFGGKQGSARAMAEMGRVLRPGGIAVVATEYVLNGRPHPEYFDERDLASYVIEPGGLQLVQEISLLAPRVLLERPLRFPQELYRVPHLSLTDGEAVWTSIVLFLEKPAPPGLDSPPAGADDRATR